MQRGLTPWSIVAVPTPPTARSTSAPSHPRVASAWLRRSAPLWLALTACSGAPPCAQDSDCAAGQVCAAQRCTPTADAGSPCSSDTQCPGAACLLGADGGQCANLCAGATDCPGRRCGPVAQGEALRLLCLPPGGERFAVERCAADAECTTGLCERGRCTTPCSAKSSCPALLRCLPGTLTRAGKGLDTGVCTTFPELPVLELGAVVVPAQELAAVEFDIPEGVAAFTVVLEDFEGLTPALARLQGPGAASIISGLPGDAGTALDFARNSSAPGLSAVLVPGSDAAQAAVRPGRYRAEVGLYLPASFPRAPERVAGTVERAAVVLKPALRPGLVDLTLHLAPETGTRTPDGGVTPFVGQMLSRFDAVLRSKANLALGEVEFRALPPDAGARVETVAQANALWAAITEPRAEARAINVLLLRELTFAAGLAGTSPGAPGVYRRPGTGVVVEPTVGGATGTGVLLAHEVLHFLGLSHTSDAFFGPDRISDTPSCANPSGGGCPDERNVMFPFFFVNEPLVLSPGQVKVLEGSPWPYQLLHPFACGEAEVVGLSEVGFAAGTTAGAPARLAGACAPSGGGERVHLLRVEADAGDLEVSATGAGFAPVLYVRRADCAAGPEVACSAPTDGGTTATLALVAAQPGAYFVVVDSEADGGTFRLTARSVP